MNHEWTRMNTNYVSISIVHHLDGKAGSMTSFESIGANSWLYSSCVLVGLRHSLTG